MAFTKYMDQMVDESRHRSVGDFGLTIVGGPNLERLTEDIINEVLEAGLKAGLDPAALTRVCVKTLNKLISLDDAQARVRSPN